MKITRVIFDTNIYGELVELENNESLTKRIISDKSFIIYGFKPIRKELRNIPKSAKKEGRNFRCFLLNLYSSLTKGRELTTSNKVEELSERIFLKYRDNGGIKRLNQIRVDFLLISCAILNRLDIVVSDDVKSMQNYAAMKAYTDVVEEDGLSMPILWSLKDIKSRFS